MLPGCALHDAGVTDCRDHRSGWPRDLRCVDARQCFAGGAHESQSIVFTPHERERAQMRQCRAHNRVQLGVEGSEHGIHGAGFRLGDGRGDRQGEAVDSVERACRGDGRPRTGGEGGHVGGDRVEEVGSAGEEAPELIVTATTQVVGEAADGHRMTLPPRLRRCAPLASIST